MIEDDVYLAPTALIALLLTPFGKDTTHPVHAADVRTQLEEPMQLQHSSDVPDGFLAQLQHYCTTGLKCEPEALIGCWLSESGLAARAQNKGALASGFFQAMPLTLRGLGFRGDATYQEPPNVVGAAQAALKLAEATHNATAIATIQAELRALDQKLSDAFCRLSLNGQLTWAYHYYLPHAGKLVNGGACYAANFVPAWVAHAADASWVICSKAGRNDAGGLTVEESEDWYRENESLDVDKDGAITMGDLAAKAAAAAATPRGLELVARLAALRGDEAAPDTQPSVPELPAEAGLDIDLSGVPDEPDDVG